RVDLSRAQSVGPFSMLWACGNKEVKEGLVHVGINNMTYNGCKFYFFLVQSLSKGGSDYAKKKPQ
ncbi:MAG: hypothetical protein R6W88_10870, partial [Desulfobacterales bacterium]